MTVRQEDLKHELRLSRGAWFVRLYVATYLASDHDINFCKLFWGLLPPVLLLAWALHLLGWAGELVYKCLDLVFSSGGDHWSSEPETPTVPHVRREPREPSRAMRMLTRAADAAVGVVGWLVENDLVVRCVMLALAAASLCGLGVGVYLVVVEWSTPVFLHVMLVIGECAATVAVIAAVTALMVWRLSWLEAFWRAMCVGARAVKTNTCPRVTLED